MAHRKKGAQDEPGEKEKAGDEVAKRLSRIAGHAASLKRLWEEDRDPDEMLTQIAAVRAALDQAAKTIMQRHLEEGIRGALSGGDPDRAVRDLKKSLDRLLS